MHVSDEYNKAGTGMKPSSDEDTVYGTSTGMKPVTYITCLLETMVSDAANSSNFYARTRAVPR